MTPTENRASTPRADPRGLPRPRRLLALYQASLAETLPIKLGLVDVIVGRHRSQVSQGGEDEGDGVQAAQRLGQHHESRADCESEGDICWIRVLRRP